MIAASLGALAYASPASATERSKTPDLSRARELDGLGVRAFKDARYRDAILFFTEAYRLGAPSSELWNIARCRKMVDEPEEESEAIQDYLAQQDLSAEERAEASKELAEIRRRPSTVAIDSSPSGGIVTIDGRRAGVTPLSSELAPGSHKLRIDKIDKGDKGDKAADARTFETTVDARFGRAVIVMAKLDRGEDVRADGPSDDRPKGAGADARALRRLSVSLEGGYFVPRLGGFSAPLAPAVHLAGRYAFVSSPRAIVHAGVRFGWTQDRWASGSLTEVPPTGCTLPRSFVANDLSLLGVVGGALRIGTRARVGGELGLGIDSLTGSEAGGEVFVPTCDPSFGARLLGHASLEASYAVVPSLRVVLSPIVFQIHSGFSGARSLPTDTTGAWWRIGSALGVAVDL
jgi:hypothetical protein